MAVHLGPRRPQGRVKQHAPGIRKIALIGTHAPTLASAPWLDPSWEIWAHASAYNVIPENAADLLIDVHPEHVFRTKRKNGYADYYGFLKRCTTPVLMQRAYPEIPASIAYPLDEMKANWPGIGFGSQAAYMIALALARGATHIGLWGINYSVDSEYRYQRGNAQLWIGLALGRGVQVTVPPGCTLLKDGDDYAYETHATPEKMAEWVKKCGWDKKKLEGPGDGKVPIGRLQLVKTEAQLRAAEQQRRETDPNWIEAARRIAQETAENPMPPMAAIAGAATARE